MEKEEQRVIKLPFHEDAHNPYDGVQKYYQANRLVRLLESQGFKVYITDDDSIKNSYWG